MLGRNEFALRNSPLRSEFTAHKRRRPFGRCDAKHNLPLFSEAFRQRNFAHSSLYKKDTSKDVLFFVTGVIDMLWRSEFALRNSPLRSEFTAHKRRRPFGRYSAWGRSVKRRSQKEFSNFFKKCHFRC